MLRGTEALCGTRCGLSTHSDWDEALRRGLQGDPTQERPLRVLPLQDTQARAAQPPHLATPLSMPHPYGMPRPLACHTP